MKPDASPKAAALSTPEEYLALGVPAEWVEPLQKFGYTTIDKIKEVEKPKYRFHIKKSHYLS